jgi:hypothetical protein
MAGKQGMQMSDKRTYDPDKLIDTCATALVEGKGGGLRSNPRLGEVSEDDRRVIARVSSLSIEDFNAKLSAKLAHIADRIADRWLEKIEADEINPNSIAFNYAVSQDKLQALTGQSSLRSASVNVTVNNFGSGSPKSAILDALTGKSDAFPPNDPPRDI